MSTAIFYDGKKFVENKFTKEDKFERVIIDNHKSIFGENTFIIDAKRKIKTKTIGGSIPDFLLFDLSDRENPEFYLVEVELAKHSFFNHIFPQITKFFAFFKSPDSQNELIDKIYKIINDDTEMRKVFKKAIGRKEIYKYVKDAVENSQNILLVIDGEKEELPEIIETYVETWDKMVQVVIVKEFSDGENTILMTEPDFSTVGLLEQEAETQKSKTTKIEYTESFHLDNTSEFVRETYNTIKKDLLGVKETLKFNPRKRYISIIDKRNFAYIKILKKKLRIVVMKSEKEVGSYINLATINPLSESVQKFYNGPSCEVIIEKPDQVPEVVELLKSFL